MSARLRTNSPCLLRADWRRRGSGGALGAAPNGLSATATLANGDKKCQYYFLEPPILVLKMVVSFSSARTFLPVRYEIKLTANSCIALSSSTNAVSFSSARMMKRFRSRCAPAIHVVRPALQLPTAALISFPMRCPSVGCGFPITPHNQEPQRGIGPRAVLSLSAVIESVCGRRGPGHLSIRRGGPDPRKPHRAHALPGVCHP